MNITVPKTIKEKKIVMEVSPAELLLIQRTIGLYHGRCNDPRCACQDILDHVTETITEATQYCARRFEKELIEEFKK